MKKAMASILVNMQKNIRAIRAVVDAVGDLGELFQAIPTKFRI